MTRLDWDARATAILAVLASAAGVAGSFAAAGETPRFVVVPVNGFVVDAMPGPVVTFSILVLGKLGEHVGFALALALTVLLLGSLVAVARLLADSALGAATYVFFGVGVLALYLTGGLVSAVATAAPMAVVLVVLGQPWRAATLSSSRRYVLKASGAVAGGGALSYLYGRGKRVPEAPLENVLPEEVTAEVERRIEEGRETSLGVRGLTSPVSIIEQYYTVDINSVDPSVDGRNWTLSVTGAVEEELEFSYEDLVSMEYEHRFVTLRCVSDTVNGKLMDNALWTGVPIERVLERADPTGEYVMLHAADGYYEEFPLAAFENGFLAFGMNGEVLPRQHGYPLRAHVLGHWGEINVKWLDEIEILESEATGYWEKKGWHGTGPVNTVAKLWAVEKREGTVRVGGYAYAGTRGIRAVEVSVDGGETWAEARLADPLPGDDVWRQWVYEWEPPSGTHEVVVRAIDGEGDVQPREEQGPYPSGATGWVREEISV